MRLNKMRFALCGLLLSGLAAQLSCSTTGQPTSHNRPLGLSNRHTLKVCASKQLLLRKDLEDLAELYGVKKSEKPSIGDIMLVNEACAKGGQKETLDLSQCQRDISCKNGIVMVPIR